MPIREDMQRVAEEIVVGHEARATGIAALRQDVATDRDSARAGIARLS